MQNSPTRQSLLGTLPARIWVRYIGSLLVFVLLVFLCAGRLDYWQGWVYVALSIAVAAVTIYVLRGRPDLIQERLSPGRGMQGWDKCYFAIYAPLAIVQNVLAFLDSGRFGWTGSLPGWVYLLGGGLFLFGHTLFIRAKAENAFFSTVVRVQTERGHAVCSSGPYALVRHPGYLGGVIYTLGTPLLLGSLWAFIPALLSIPPLIWRILMEERTLGAELAGYAAYMRTVRWRLIPGVW